MDEAARIHRRRQALGLGRRTDADSPRWGLAFSGGGVRSAAFCLGVLQALARARTPAPADDALHGDADPPGTSRNGDGVLLNEFDYLSTTGGGGYAGAFFCSLFQKDRLEADLPERNAARRAVELLAAGGGEASDMAPRVLRWLRDYGRTITPGGAGGIAFSLAQILRNWLALQLIVGSALALVFGAVALAMHASVAHWLGLGRLEMDLLHDARQAFFEDRFVVWWSPLLVFGGYFFVVCSVAAFGAYFLRQPDRTAGTGTRGRIVPWAYGLGVMALFLLISLMPLLWDRELYRAILLLLATPGAWFLLAFALAWVAGRAGTMVADAYFVRLTWIAAWTIAIAAALVSLGMADTVARTIYLYAMTARSQLSLLSVLGLLVVMVLAAGFGGVGALVSVFRMATAMLKIEPQVARLPDTLLPAGAAASLIFLNAVMCDVVVLWVRWNGREPADWLVFGNAGTAPGLTMLLLACAAAVLVAGRWPRLLDMTASHTLYAARVTGAFLAASNWRRYTGDARTATAGEPVEGDHILLRDYFSPAQLGPLHLINLHVADTVDRRSGVVHRRRRGRSMCVGPGPARGLDAQHAHYADDNAAVTCDGKAVSGAPSLDVGQWIATSGISAPIGFGRTSSLATALYLGMANVRLGRWWRFDEADHDPGGAGEGRARFSLSRLAGGILPNYRLLAHELTASFDGYSPGWRYLTDGGDFNKLGIYELLREPRRVSFILACDCTVDPTYAFEEYGRLVTLAREDLGLELVADPKARDISPVFGSLEDFRAGAQREPGGGIAPADAPVALLINVYAAGAQVPASTAKPRPRCRIVLLKPRVTAAMGDDLRIHAASQGGFPHEPATDRKMSADQWDLYRQLGTAVASAAAGGIAALEGAAA